MSQNRESAGRTSTRPGASDGEGLFSPTAAWQQRAVRAGLEVAYLAPSLRSGRFTLTLAFHGKPTSTYQVGRDTPVELPFYLTFITVAGSARS
jgi:hypothetical protein